MAENQPTPAADETKTPMADRPVVPKIIIQQQRAGVFGRIFIGLLVFALFFSVIMNIGFIASSDEFLKEVSGAKETYHSGSKSADDKIALIDVSWTIMPPYTERTLSIIEKIKKDDDIKGAILVVDSPGGLVADSHQIYHRLKELSTKKPIYVAMKRIAASGGYYIAMGAGEEGKIFMEPTTWTGSIGVIIPRYDVSEFAKTYGIKSDPLTTGEFKNALSPFKPLSEREKDVWTEIMNDSYNRFIDVIAENRKPLDKDAVKKLATGQIYTTDMATKNGLADEVGYLDDVVESLKKKLSLSDAQVVTYEYPPTLSDVLLGAEFQQPDANAQLKAMLELSVPKAMYLYSWGLGLPGATN